MGCSCSSSKSCSPSGTVRSISTAPLPKMFKIDTKPCRYYKAEIQLKETQQSTILKRRNQLAQAKDLRITNQ